MWIDRNLPYRWEAVRRLTQILRLIYTRVTALAVERIGRTYPQLYQQEETFSHPIHILEMGESHAHIWGDKFTDKFSQTWTSPQRKPVIHR